jgi:hypothetical protein
MVTIPDIEVEAEEIDNTEPSLAPPMMAPEPTPSRPVSLSLPSAYELESERKSSPPVIARRKELQTYVASFVGVAWFICTFAVGQTALRSLIVSVMR